MLLSETTSRRGPELWDGVKINPNQRRIHLALPKAKGIII